MGEITKPCEGCLVGQSVKERVAEIGSPGDVESAECDAGIRAFESEYSATAAGQHGCLQGDLDSIGTTGAQDSPSLFLSGEEGDQLFQEEQQRIYKAYSEAYSNFFRVHMPDTGVPSRFTVHVMDFPDKAASYEFYSVGLYQPALHGA